MWQPQKPITRLPDTWKQLSTLGPNLIWKKVCGNRMGQPDTWNAAKTIPAVRLTCIACFLPISQSILNRFL